MIERLKNREAIPAEPTLTACFQPLECEDAPLREEWATHWKDFEFVPMRRLPGGGGSSRPVQPPRMCCARRSRVINAASLGRSCSVRAVNFNPKPVPARAWRTTASARI